MVTEASCSSSIARLPMPLRSLGWVIGGPISVPGPPEGQDSALRCTLATQSAGLAISALVGRVFGEVQTRLKPSMPTSSTTDRTNFSPSLYCRSLASRPRSLRRAWSRRPAALGAALLELLADLGDGADDLGAHAVHHEVRVSFEEGHDGGEAAEHFALGGGLDDVDEAPAAVLALFALGPSGAGEGLGGLAEALQEGHRVDVGLVEERLDLALEVVAEPGHAGELGAVGLLVEGDPEPEVVRVDVQLAFDVDDVGGDEEQLGRRRLRRRAGLGWPGRTSRTGRGPGRRGRRAACPARRR